MPMEDADHSSCKKEDVDKTTAPGPKFGTQQFSFTKPQFSFANSATSKSSSPSSSSSQFGSFPSSKSSSPFAVTPNIPTGTGAVRTITFFKLVLVVYKKEVPVIR